MRDLIWTLILVWVVYRLFTAFRFLSDGKSRRSPENPAHSGSQPQNGNHAPHDSEKKKALRRRLNEEGEYVDFEEIR